MAPFMLLGCSDIWERKVPVDARSSLVQIDTRDDAGTTLRDLLSWAVSDIFQNRLNFDNVMETAQHKSLGRSIHLTSVGPADVGMLKRALAPVKITRLGSQKLLAENQSFARNDYRNAIAVVGMSCRTPGAQNVDELWELLMEGRDMHRQVTASTL